MKIGHSILLASIMTVVTNVSGAVNPSMGGDGSIPCVSYSNDINFRFGIAQDGNFALKTAAAVPGANHRIEAAASIARYLKNKSFKAVTNLESAEELTRWQMSKGYTRAEFTTYVVQSSNAVANLIVRKAAPQVPVYMMASVADANRPGSSISFDQGIFCSR